MKTKTKIILLVLLFLVVAPSSALLVFYQQVTRDTAKRIQKGAIQEVIASESPVFYDDGQTPIGVFFDKTHRRYVRYSNIPKWFIKALIATEDRDFFHNPGFEIKSILRAFIANLKAGRVVQGGSTLTQQLAKNIFKRKKRSYRAKLRELIEAVLLHRRYTKQEILEMYANQFFVTGYGKGIGIAAKYFFDKQAKDLDLVESAFIAGMLQAPIRYNPFIKKTEAERAEAIRLANMRKNYTLSNMLKVHYITRDQFLKAKARKIPFKEGRITYRLNVILDYVRDQLESKYFQRILHAQGIDNIATSGIKIYTSINKEIQKAALMNLRNYLPPLDVQLNGYNQKKRNSQYQVLKNLGIIGDRQDDLPFLARITHISTRGNNGYIFVSWKGGGGIIDYQGLEPIGRAWLKWKLGKWAVFTRRRVPLFLKQFHVGNLIAVRRVPKPGSPQARQLMLTVFPELEGGIVVLHDGMIKTMVGGFSNRYFNRTVYGKRQLGSIFKPIVYTAALQLKWNPLDPLPNMRDLYRFENTYYFPKPDHPPESNKVSMAWAGAKSENLATIWLLYHLTDRLNLSEFREVVHLLDLDRKKDETYVDYKRRIRDQYGVVVNRNAMMDAAFEQAKKDVEPDIIFGGQEQMLETLRRLHYNLPAKAFRHAGFQGRKIQRYDFTRLRRLNQRMKRRWAQITLLLHKPWGKRPDLIAGNLSFLLQNFYTVDPDSRPARIIYTEHPQNLGETGLRSLYAVQLLQTNSIPASGKIWIDDLMTSDIVDLLQDSLEVHYMDFLNYNRYDPEILYRIRDFRTLVNLSYVVYLAKKMGINSYLDRVLSFPLGSNAISIMEAAEVYQSIMTGQTYRLSRENSTPMVPIITKIADRNGEIIWQYRPEPRQIFSRDISRPVIEILRKVVEIGTARKALDAIRVDSLPLACFGKTGTSNRFTNSGFVGFIPGPGKTLTAFNLKDGYVIAGYIGYDDNRPMKGKHFAVYGSSGALPLWIDTARAIAGSSKYRSAVGPAELAFSNFIGSLTCPDGFKEIPLSPITGLPGPESMSGGPRVDDRLLTFCAPVQGSDETIRLIRKFEPLEGGKK